MHWIRLQSQEKSAKAASFLRYFPLTLLTLKTLETTICNYLHPASLGWDAATSPPDCSDLHICRIYAVALGRRVAVLSSPCLERARGPSSLAGSGGGRNSFAAVVRRRVRGCSPHVFIPGSARGPVGFGDGRCCRAEKEWAASRLIRSFSAAASRRQDRCCLHCSGGGGLLWSELGGERKPTRLPR
jgi:hypothetical protein